MMTTRRTKRDALWMVLPALLLGLACGDDSSNKPTTDSGTVDGPPGLQDGQIPSETSTPPGDGYPDGSRAPTVLTAHMREACSTGLYSIDVAPGKEQSTCDDIGTKGIVYLQVLFGDAESKPPPSGRTYVVKHPSQLAGIYPEDGEASAVYIAPGGSQNVKSGSFTIDPYTGGASVFTGSFNVTLDNNQQVNATYLSDFCPFDPSSCD
jgi:hypothetical protein